MVGVAPQVNLMVARVLDRNGQGNYSDVIAAIEWVLAHQERYNVRVLNLSLYAPVGAPYWADPLNQAVMRAWQAGIVVVTAAGNSGPEAGTITAPGNIPYVITVGAVRSGRFNQSGFDELAAYSSRGPTESAFVKPDVVVPASRTIAPLPQHSAIVDEMPSSAVVAQAKVDFKLGAFGGRQVYGELSGTSMAAAQVSGIVALMLQVNPSLSNDQVKARLLNTARSAVDATTGAPIYSVWEQGAGLVDVQSAVFAPEAGRANEGMDLVLDLTTDTHYWGNTIWDEATSQFLLVDPSTGQQLQAWGGGSYVWAGGSYVWAGGSYVWAGGSYVWAGGSYVWAGNTALWAGALRPWLRITGATAASASVLYEP
jgi:subtilisin family serine protease